MIELQSYLDKQKKFFQTGVTKDISCRIEQLKKLKQILVDNEQLLIEEVHKDFQKSAFETYVTEIGLVTTDINYAIKNVESWSKQQSVSTPLVNFPSKNFIITEPYGSALIIAPWNYPILLALQPLVGAIAAGNTAILKPSELTPNTSSLLEKLISENFDEDFESYSWRRGRIFCSGENGFRLHLLYRKHQSWKNHHAGCCGTINSINFRTWGKKPLHHR